MPTILETMLNVAAGALIAVLIQQLYKKVTKRDCSDCGVVKQLNEEILIIKGILLQLAQKAGIDIEDYKDLLK